jgi:elongin-A
MAASLFDMAQRACIRNVMDMYDVGDLRYETIRPVLKRVTNPAQLVSTTQLSNLSALTNIAQRQIEEASPHIAEDDAELWEAFIRRDILKAESKLKSTRPKNPSSWWKVYRKLKREDEADTKEAEERLKATLNRHKVDKGAKQTHIVHAVIPSGEKRPAWNSSTPRDKPFGNQALKNAKTTAQTITVLKRQTAQRQAGRSVAQSVPMHQLSQLRGKVQEAPAHMIRNYAQKPGPTRPPVAVPQAQAYRPVFARAAPTYADRALTTAINQTKQEQEAKERRLLALTSGSSGNKPRPTAAASSNRPTPQPRPSPVPAPKPVPVPSSSSSMLARKRPAYDPFLPSKKRRS